MKNIKAHKKTILITPWLHYKSQIPSDGIWLKLKKNKGYHFDVAGRCAKPSLTRNVRCSVALKARAPSIYPDTQGQCHFN